MARNGNVSYIVAVSRGELTIDDTWYSRSYGIKERNRTLRLTLNAILPTEIVTTVSQEPAV